MTTNLAVIAEQVAPLPALPAADLDHAATFARPCAAKSGLLRAVVAGGRLACRNINCGSARPAQIFPLAKADRRSWTRLETGESDP
jgi:hypothetical protein